MMPQRNILVVAVDGLRASALGAYGNTAYETPALDQLAAESFLFDACFAPTAELPAIYRALWQSVHPLRTSEYAARMPTLPNVLAEQHYSSTLVTDAAEVASCASAAGFGEYVQVSGDIAERVDEISQTALARLFAAACDAVPATGDVPRLVWVHSRGMYGPWDAPVVLQQSLLDEGDPRPLNDVVPPDVSIGAQDDPDTAFRCGVAYAAQVMVLDACWAALSDALAATGEEWLLMLLGVRGYALGEHARVGGVDRRLHAEQLHVPWIVRSPDGAGRLARTRRLMSPLDLFPTLLPQTDLGPGNRSMRYDGRSVVPLLETTICPWRDALLSTSEGEFLAFRTPGWSLQCNVPSRTAQLFVRPDDRWEANDIAALCPDVVEALTLVAEDACARIQQGEPVPEEPLADHLRGFVA
jgi:arylsulfatase A-like enzyme